MIDESSRTCGDGLPTSLAKRMLQGAGAAVGLTIFNLAIQRPPKASLWLILCAQDVSQCVEPSRIRTVRLRRALGGARLVAGRCVTERLRLPPGEH